ncbi:sensor histidine kinase [Methyloterricola oryzae]|uniref:sensor histidine kinase n=1 Tax=Methyloterricola oryzae TaxID=1495050 RepID=UPI000A4EBDFE|nr:ATP-binding protein [Methyloterricola oryzae]
MNQTYMGSAETLKDAFQVFNELSENLTRSYLDLESQVGRLTAELAAARSERLSTLMEKEKLAIRLQRLLEALPGGVLVTDGKGRVVEHNAAASAMLGGDLKGRRWLEALDAAALPLADTPNQRQLLDGRTVSLSLNPLVDEPGQIILLTDISEVRALQEMVSQQKRLSALGEMVASLAHQVRTPLSAALLYASNLGGEQLSGAQRARFAAKLVERLQHMERQVNDMLAFARIGRLSLEKIDASGLLRQVAESFEPPRDGRQVRLDLGQCVGECEIFGNQDALLGILHNLINNAVEAFAGQPGTIRLSLEQPGASRLRIVVADDGPGIPEDVRPHIFEPFFTTRAQGTGLGLAIVDCVVRSHGGCVTCQSKAGKGTRFLIDLPVAGAGSLLPGGYRGKQQSPGVQDHVPA